MIRKTGEMTGSENQTGDSDTGVQSPVFSCIILADRGGVGKTATAALIWALFAELGVHPRVGEVEGPTERKMSALLAMDQAGVMNQAGAPDPSVTMPTPAECTQDSRANARAFAPALEALVMPSRPTILDNGATVSRAFLDAAEAADHGEQTDGGRDLRIVIVAKAEDLQSATSAEASLRRARAIYPNARFILAVTHVRFDRQRSTHNAGTVVSAVQANGKTADIVLVPLLNSPFMGELYGEQHIPFHVLASLSIAKLTALVGDAVEQEVRIYRGQYLTWYNTALAHFATALDVPAPAERTTKGATLPLVEAGATA